MHIKHPFIFAFLFAIPLFAFAQTATTTDPTALLQAQIDALIQERIAQAPTAEDIRVGAIRDLLNVTTTPKNPAPHDVVQIKVESYLTDLSKATLSWAKNGTTVLRGIGQTEFSFENGGSGVTTTIRLSITTNAGEVITRNFSFRPIGVTLLWEANTYTPPFYKGKPLMSAQANVRAIAVSDTALLDVNNMSFVWKKDGEAVPGASGYGKNSFIFTGPKPYGRANISVEASSLSDSMRSETSLKEIALTRPFVFFYENHPLLGIWYNTPLESNLTLNKKEFSLVAAPYFFSRDNGESSAFAYAWSLNNKTISNPGTAITLRNDQGTQGDSLLALAIRGLNQTFQSGSQSLLIHFTTEEASRGAF